MKKIILFLSLVSLDQLLKFFAPKGLPSASGILEYVCNKNIAWSISIAPGVFYFIWTAVFLSLVYFFLKSIVNLERTALLLILSGAFSNLLDRLTRGCVVDFINLKIWPVFNLADIYITIGIISLAIIYIKHKIFAKDKNLQDRTDTKY
jgi:signal peptidase II